MVQDSVLIVDYGSGNLRSAAGAFERVIRDEGRDCTVTISDKPEDVLSAQRIVLPGQGAFRDCMEALRGAEGMIDALEERVLHGGAPFLGICVGMQIMASRGQEHGVTAGLNWIEGEVIPIAVPEVAQGERPLKIPHMGWNDLKFFSASTQQDNRHFVLRSTDSFENFYFLHSFMFQCTYRHHCLAVTEYGGFIPAVVGRDNMIGVQFHPEKSHMAGLNLISGFLDWKP